MLMTIAIILWVAAVAWFLVTWALFRIHDLRLGAPGRIGGELQLDHA